MAAIVFLGAIVLLTTTRKSAAMGGIFLAPADGCSLRLEWWGPSGPAKKKTGGSQQVAGGMWPNCLGAVRKAGIRGLHWPLG